MSRHHMHMPPFITALLLLADDHAAALVRRLGLFIVLGGVFLTTAGAEFNENSGRVSARVLHCT